MSTKAITWTIIGGGVGLVGVVIPALFFVVTGRFPPGYPIQYDRNQAAATATSQSVDAKNATPTAPVQRLEQFSLDNIKGFTPNYYEPSRPPDLAQLKRWHGTVVNFNVEDEAGYRAQNELLERRGAPAIPLPDMAPPSTNLEQVVGELVQEARNQGLAVSLGIPVSERWLTLAQQWQVEMVWINGESDGFIERAGLTVADVNQINALLLAETRQYYTGTVGVGFTNLVDRRSLQPVAAAADYDVTGFDYVTINPHPDPSMRGETLVRYASETAQAARAIADRSGVKHVLLGAIIVKTATDEPQGFMPAESQRYTEGEESELYRQLFAATGDRLDGYFLDFSGWETRSAAGTISEFYGQ